MVLDVVSNIKGDPIKRAIVGIGFLAVCEHVVLVDKMRSHWVEAVAHN